LPSTDVIEVPDSSFPHLTVSEQRFIQNLDLCLTYHHESETLHGQEGTEARRLGSLLRQHFSSELYAPRVEVNDIAISCETKNLVLLVGLLGVGKSTLLLELKTRLEATRSEGGANFEPRAKFVVVYVNVAAKVPELGELQKVAEAPICALTHNQLHERVKEEGLNDDFVAFSIRHGQKYRALLSAMQAESRCVDLGNEEIHRFLAVEAYKDKKRDLDLQQPGDAEFLCLLRFVTERLGEPVLIFDNTDGFSTKLQNAVLVKSRNVLRGHCTPILAIRTSNVRQLSRKAGESSQAQPPIEHEVRSYLALTPKSTRPARHQLLTGLTTVKDVLVRRIAFLRQHTLEDHQVEFGDRLREFVETFLQAPFFPRLLSHLLEWNNHSIRHVARDIAKMSAILVCNQDPVFSPAFFQQGPRRLRARRAKSFLYKFMTCGGKPLYDGVLGALNLFVTPHSTPLMPFPELAVLLTLSSAGASSVSDDTGRLQLGELAELFGHFGLKRYAVIEVVNRCTNPGLRDDMGFVHVHNRPHRLEKDSSDHTEIELQPRGDFLCSELVMTCEYLFWCAVDSPHAKDHYTRIKYMRTRRDAERVSVAAKFFRAVVWKKLQAAEVKIRSLGDVDVRGAYERVFPEAGLPRFVRLIVDNLSQFVVAAESDLEGVDVLAATARESRERQTGLVRNARADLEFVAHEVSR
jgi:energy-coupling factor transporter ATP-binding protein EcfA2